jgi:hypothetical protein
VLVSKLGRGVLAHTVERRHVERGSSRTDQHPHRERAELRIDGLAERTAQVRDRGVGCAPRGRLPGRIDQDLGQLRIASAFRAQHVHGDPLGFGAVIAQQRCSARVRRGGLGTSEVAVDGIADHRVQEPRRTSQLEHSRCRECVGGSARRRGLELRKAHDHRRAGAVAQHRDRPGVHGCLSAQCCDSGDHRALHGHWCDVMNRGDFGGGPSAPARAQLREQLAEQEGVPATGPPARFAERVLRRGTKTGADHRCDRAEAEGSGPHRQTRGVGRDLTDRFGFPGTASDDQRNGNAVQPRQQEANEPL